MEDNSNRHGIDPSDSDRYIGGPHEEPQAQDMLSELDRMMGTMLPGWQGLETTGQMMAQQRTDNARQMQKLANSYRECFSTAAGKAVLDDLISMTLRAEPYPEDMQLSIDQITPLVLAHDVRCRFVRGILSAIAQAKNIAPDNNDKDE